MKTKDLTQNVIVNLNYDKLNTFLRLADKNHRLLGYNGCIGGEYSSIDDKILLHSYIDDKILLHRFGYLKGTYDALDLLGEILNHIDDCLAFKYYFTYENKEYYCIGGYMDDDLDEVSIHSTKWVYNKNDETFDEENININGDIHAFILSNKKDILVEINRTSKYYKEYYTRLFDRGRTVK